METMTEEHPDQPLPSIPTAAAQAALFRPGCLRAACAGAGICSGLAAQPWSLGGRAGRSQSMESRHPPSLPHRIPTHPALIKTISPFDPL